MASQASQPELSSVLAELQDLRQKVEDLEKDHGVLSDNQFIQLRLINGLREETHKEPKASTGTKTTARIAKLKEILKARGGSQTFQKLQEENRVVPNPASQRSSKAARAAEVFSKGMCKRFKGTPEEVVEAFLELVAKPEFRTEAIDCITAFHKNFGESKLGFIKTSNRKGNPAAQEALAKARAGKKK